jgi:hypothetical protein
MSLAKRSMAAWESEFPIGGAGGGDGLWEGTLFDGRGSVTC